MKKIPTWLWVTGAVVGIWYLSKPKTGAGATGGATGAATGVAGSLDAGRMHHGGGHVHHGGGHRGFVGRSVDFIDYGVPVDYVQCDPRVPCGRQPILPCRCG